ncbi:MAG TPA: asparagine synthetase B, partial [Gemmatimonadetes bacterium]|nr:asparagine synthetase B [Gemmatimonadota bacterium]
MRIARIVCVMAFVAWPMAGAAQSVLVPMDRIQENHLKAYGLTYWALEQY